MAEQHNDDHFCNPDKQSAIHVLRFMQMMYSDGGSEINDIIAKALYEVENERTSSSNIKAILDRTLKEFEQWGRKQPDIDFDNLPQIDLSRIFKRQ